MRELFFLVYCIVGAVVIDIFFQNHERNCKYDADTIIALNNHKICMNKGVLQVNKYWNLLIM